MKHLRIVISLFLLVCVAGMASAGNAAARASRRYVEEGNKLYGEKRYSEAEAQYRKALQAEPGGMVSAFNLAASLLRQATPGESGKKLMAEAGQLLADVMDHAGDPKLSSLAAYNLGNMAYNSEQWDQAINFYKAALRKNPDDDNARDNLRMAQLKKRNRQDNQDKKDDKKEDKKEDKKDDQKQQPQQQPQNQPQNQQNQNQQQQPPQPRSIDPANAEKILKAMENEEAATRRRVEAELRRGNASGRRQPTKPW